MLNQKFINNNTDSFYRMLIKISYAENLIILPRSIWNALELEDLKNINLKELQFTTKEHISHWTV